MARETGAALLFAANDLVGDQGGLYMVYIRSGPISRRQSRLSVEWLQRIRRSRIFIEAGDSSERCSKRRQTAWRSMAARMAIQGLLERGAAGDCTGV